MLSLLQKDKDGVFSRTVLSRNLKFFISSSVFWAGRDHTAWDFNSSMDHLLPDESLVLRVGLARRLVLSKNGLGGGLYPGLIYQVWELSFGMCPPYLGSMWEWGDKGWGIHPEHTGPRPLCEEGRAGASMSWFSANSSRILEKQAVSGFPRCYRYTCHKTTMSTLPERSPFRTFFLKHGRLRGRQKPSSEEVTVLETEEWPGVCRS